MPLPPLELERYRRMLLAHGFKKRLTDVHYEKHLTDRWILAVVNSWLDDAPFLNVYNNDTLYWARSVVFNDENELEIAIIFQTLRPFM